MLARIHGKHRASAKQLTFFSTEYQTTRNTFYRQLHDHSKRNVGLPQTSSSCSMTSLKALIQWQTWKTNNGEKLGISSSARQSINRAVYCSHACASCACTPCFQSKLSLDGLATSISWWCASCSRISKYSRHASISCMRWMSPQWYSTR